MAINRDNTPYPSSGGIIGIASNIGDDLIVLRGLVDGNIPTDETTVGDINVNGCQTIKIWIKTIFINMTGYNISVFWMNASGTSIFTFSPVKVWDISDASFDSLASVLKGRIYNFGVTGNDIICVPTYGAHTIRIKHIALGGSGLGSFSTIKITRGWSMHHTLSNSTVVTQA